MADDGLHPVEAAGRQRTFILWVMRAAFLLVLLAVSLLALIRADAGDTSSAGDAKLVLLWSMVAVAFALFFAALAIDIVTPNKKASTLASALVGALAGLLATVAIGFVIDLAVEAWIPDADTLKNMEGPLRTVKIMLGITLVYLGMSTVLQTQDDFRLLIPYVEFSKSLRGPRPLLADSSVLIDARLADIATTGVLQAPIVVPRFVVSELQLLADSSEKMKRTRGRSGLDIITRLQRTPGLDITIDEAAIAGKNVDTMLIELAKRMSGIVVTTDTGLSRVAQIQDVPVLNINDLSNALKPSLGPGERLDVHVLRHGEQEGQGVGYLDDGTMVVIEQGASQVNQQAEVEVTSTLQTSAGRMIFARLIAFDEAPKPSIAQARALAQAAPAQKTASDDAPAREHGEPAPPETAEEPEEDAAPADEPKRDGPFPPNRARRGPTRRNPRR
jgi:uncharacterized protein YacL